MPATSHQTLQRMALALAALSRKFTESLCWVKHSIVEEKQTSHWKLQINQCHAKQNAGIHFK
jgi:hypothetical protein